ncbi:MAG: PIN domain-containing protein [Moorea sp. SIO2B7]|nr:PIN domain-containing protein [Moorena sp. SIO2B7]
MEETENIEGEKVNKLSVCNEDNFETILKYQHTLFSKTINLEVPQLLIDTSLIIDVLLGRDSIFLEEATKIIQLVFSGEINWYITGIGLRDIWDIIRKLKGKKDANYLIIKLLNSFSVCNLNKETIKNSSNYYLNSIESAIQIEFAKNNKIDGIITLREKYFLGCGWDNIFTPAQFLDEYESFTSFFNFS